MDAGDRQRVGTRVRVLAVWDQQLGDGHGGTASFVESASEMGAEVVIIPLEPSTG